MTPDSLAVVGTDTGVGKTVVTAGLVGWLRAEGVDARGIKPCQTGYPPDDDAGFVADACGTAEAATCLQRLEPALAPAVAAAEADESLAYEDIHAGCETAIDAVESAVVEGIGGLRVPLADGREVVDLVADLDLPTIVVARAGLGTLNHTALTVEALRARDLSVRGIVLNQYEGATVAERTNPAVLAETNDLPVATVPPLDLSNPANALDGIRDNIPRHFPFGE